METWPEEILFSLKQRSQNQSIPFKNLIPACNILHSIQYSRVSPYFKIQKSDIRKRKYNDKANIWVNVYIEIQNK